MAVATVHYLHGVQFPSSNFVSQVTSANVSLQNDELVSRGAGDPRPFFTAIRGQNPRVTFSTTQIAKALDTIGQYGADLSGGNVDLLFRQATDLGTRVATGSSAHQRFRMAQTFGYFSQITASHQQDASIDVELIPTWNGSVAPVVYAGSQALTGTPSGSELFTLGPVVLNGVELDGVQEVTIASGLQVLVAGSSGELWPTFAGCKTIEPMVTIRGLDLPEQWAYGIGGTALSALTVYLRKKAATGGNVANATTSHIAITAAAGCIYPQDSSGDLENESNHTLVVRITAADASSDPLAIDTASAIS